MKKRLSLLLAVMLISIAALLAACGGAESQITVRFLDGNTEISHFIVGVDGTVGVPKDPEKNGWFFDYWELDGKEFDFTKKITKNTVVKAKWSEAVTVIFTGEGYTETKQTVRKGSSITPPLPGRENYAFKGWKKSGDTDFFDFGEVLESATVVAVWNIKHTIIFGGDGVSPSSTSVESGELLEKPQDPSRTDDWRFDGWKISGSGEYFDFLEPVGQSYILTAAWSRMYKVTLKKDNGSSDEVIRVAEGTAAGSIADPEKSPQADWRFDGWKIDGTDTTFDPETEIITADIALAAVWTRMYQVTIDFDNGDANLDVRVEAGTLIPAGHFAEPEKTPAEEWKFLGWINDESQTPFDHETETVSSDLYIKAQWARMHLVTIDYDNGEEQVSMRVQDGEIISSEYFSGKVRGQDRFDKWVEGALMQDFDPAAAVTKDLSIKAKWIRYLTVTFNDEHGSRLAVRNVYEGEALDSVQAAPDTETRLFKNWVFTSGGNGIYLPAMVITEDSVITAVMADGYKVSFAAPEGIIADVQRSSGTAVTLPRLFEEGTLLKFRIIKAPNVTGNFVVNIDRQPATAIDGWFSVTVAQAAVVIEVTGAASLNGIGTKSSPVVISTAEALEAFRDAVNAGNTQYSRGYIELGADIVLTSDWTPIGLGELYYVGTTPYFYQMRLFGGVFDGKGFSISGVRMNVTDPNTTVTGFFGVTNDAVIKNLRLINVDYTVVAAEQNYIGGLVGESRKTNIINCSVSGNISVRATDFMDTIHVGGIAGRANKSIDNCHANVNITQNDAIATISRIGGLVGSAIEGSTNYSGYFIIRNSYTEGTITAGASLTGGILGYLPIGTYCTVYKCYSSINIKFQTIESSLDTSSFGGVIGETGSTSASSPPQMIVDNCFFFGSFEIISDAQASKWYCFSGIVGYGEYVNNEGNPPIIQNSYYMETVHTWLTAQTKYYVEHTGSYKIGAGETPVTIGLATTAAFEGYTGWNLGIWTIVDGALPKLASNPDGGTINITLKNYQNDQAIASGNLPVEITPFEAAEILAGSIGWSQPAGIYWDYGINSPTGATSNWRYMPLLADREIAFNDIRNNKIVTYTSETVFEMDDAMADADKFAGASLIFTPDGYVEIDIDFTAEAYAALGLKDFVSGKLKYTKTATEITITIGDDDTSTADITLVLALTSDEDGTWFSMSFGGGAVVMRFIQIP